MSAEKNSSTTKLGKAKPTVKKSGTGKPAAAPKKKGQPAAANRKRGTSAPSGKKKTDSGRHEGMPKSATVLAVERQQKIEKMSPLGQITAELPVIGNRSLDAPIRGPRIRIKKPKFDDFKFDWESGKRKKLLIGLGVLVLLLVIGLLIISKYTVDTVIIEGNRHYTNDEIYNMVIGEKKYETNSIYLSMKYKNKEIEDIPFIQTMSVKIVDSKTIKITVYEKALAGYIEYLDRYFYFDKDGTVVESTNVKTTGIPQVLGLDFDHVVMYEKLPIESEEIFGQILEMTQLLDKYDIEMDKIYFDKKYNMTLYFGEARIKVGNFDYIDEKIIKLKSILPELEGKSGVLRLDNYKGSDDIITFEMD